MKTLLPRLGWPVGVSVGDCCQGPCEGTNRQHWNSWNTDRQLVARPHLSPEEAKPKDFLCGCLNYFLSLSASLAAHDFRGATPV